MPVKILERKYVKIAKNIITDVILAKSDELNLCIIFFIFLPYL